jgi:2-amino-4-hydroxy-6-hydroxymethyldihydropteridine diphosphokinase
LNASQRPASHPVTAFVALGSNLGDRDAHLAFALGELGALPGVKVEAVSPVYETDPVGPPQGPYLNAAARLHTTLAPHVLLAAMLAIEARAGRKRDPSQPLAPRTLDLDLLLYGSECVEAPGLEVPHPRLHERAFVLIPLADVGGEVIHPVLGEPIRVLVAPYAQAPGVRRWPKRLALPKSAALAPPQA